MKIIFHIILLFLINSICFSQVENINMRRESQWTKNSIGTTCIEVTFENPEGFNREIDLIKQAINSTWAKYGNIEFYNWGKSSLNQQGIRILIVNRSDMSDEAWPHTIALGKELNGRYGGMVLNFVWPGYPVNISNDDAIKFTAVHEFGHALGLAHEQIRQDVLCDCPKALREDNINGGAQGGWFFLTCDYQSVMNYCNPNWNNWGVLSNLDIKGIQTIYGINPKLNSNFIKLNKVTIHNKLGAGQTWENLYIILGNEQQMLHVDSTNNHDICIFFSREGDLYYKLWSNTYYSNKMIKGYGEGFLYIPEKSNLNYEIFITEDFSSGIGKLELKHVNPL